MSLKIEKLLMNVKVKTTENTENYLDYFGKVKDIPFCLTFILMPAILA